MLEGGGRRGCAVVDLLLALPAVVGVAVLVVGDGLLEPGEVVLVQLVAVRDEVLDARGRAVVDVDRLHAPRLHDAVRRVAVAVQHRAHLVVDEVGVGDAPLRGPDPQRDAARRVVRGLEALVVHVHHLAVARVVVLVLLLRLGLAQVVAALVGTAVVVVDDFAVGHALDVEAVVVRELGQLLDLEEALVEVLVGGAPRVEAARAELIDEDLIRSGRSEHDRF